MNKLIKKRIRKIIMIVVILLCDLLFLKFELVISDHHNGRVYFIEHNNYINYGLTQEDLNKLDIADYKILDYLDEQCTSKWVKYYNSKLCEVCAMISCENFSKEKINKLIDYSNIYFFEKFGPEIYQYGDRVYGYGYTYNDMQNTRSINDDEIRYGSTRIYPTQRRVFMSNLYLKFEAGINYYFDNKTLYISLGYSILNEKVY